MILLRRPFRRRTLEELYNYEKVPKMFTDYRFKRPIKILYILTFIILTYWFTLSVISKFIFPSLYIFFCMVIIVLLFLDVHYSMLFIIYTKTHEKSDFRGFFYTLLRTASIFLGWLLYIAVVLSIGFTYYSAYDSKQVALYTKEIESTGFTIDSEYIHYDNSLRYLPNNYIDIHRYKKALIETKSIINSFPNEFYDECLTKTVCKEGICLRFYKDSSIDSSLYIIKNNFSRNSSLRDAEYDINPDIYGVEYEDSKPLTLYFNMHFFSNGESFRQACAYNFSSFIYTIMEAKNPDAFSEYTNKWYSYNPYNFRYYDSDNPSYESDSSVYGNAHSNNVNFVNSRCKYSYVYDYSYLLMHMLIDDKDELNDKLSCPSLNDKSNLILEMLDTYFESFDEISNMR